MEQNRHNIIAFPGAWQPEAGEAPDADGAANARIEEIRAEMAGHPMARWAFGSVLSAGGLAVLFRCPWWAILLSLAKLTAALIFCSKRRGVSNKAGHVASFKRP